MEKARAEYLDQIEGLGKRMPVTFLCFTVASLALMGIPPLPGFFSKWDIASASLGLGNVFGLIGLAALLISAVLTVLYQIGTVTAACLPVHTESQTQPETGRLETAGMTAPIAIITVCIVALGLLYAPIHNWLTAIL